MASEGAGVAVAIFLRQYYRKNNATPPNFDPEGPGTEYPDRTPCAELSETQTGGLDQLEYFCKGTVLKRMMKCGKAQCACASDPDKASRGLYFELTYKANGKTINVKLSPEAASALQCRLSCNIEN